MAAVAQTSEDLLIEARWRGTPACPSCKSSRALPISHVGGLWSRWRCGDCRKRYGVTTGTAIHSTKLSPGDWVAVVELCPPTPAAITASRGVSQTTARRLSALLRPVWDRSPTERLWHLMHSGRDAAPRKDPWQVDLLPMGLRAEESSLVSLSAGAKATLNALRHRPFGATAPKLAALSGLSYSQTSRCLTDLERRGWATRTKTTLQHGYRLRAVNLWTLSWSDGCMRALAFLRDIPTKSPPDADDLVPSRFWRNFWSGASADTLRISQHGLHIAETLIAGRDPCARAWAISALPTDILRECRALRGCDSGMRAELIDAELTRRAAKT